MALTWRIISLQEVTINVPVPPGTKSRFLVADIKNTSLKVGLKGQPLIIDGELFKAVKGDDYVCYWSLEDQNEVSILFTKQNKCDWWKSLFKGGPEIVSHSYERLELLLEFLDFLGLYCLVNA
ncbi:PREDICTED: protein BOBBER 1-like [Nicotiana attenuata]|uniref:Protein bobber 1 n=1 Tax=Nicotiana attenuata TaxID=49451 RepID=A0A314KMJ0_NICAT|nr:PREDICTED: protein BOBBER 1-like [Nicotiana attenuata]OIT30566.1 protein bobber 1 [Nicotiana attenuata]